LQKGAQIFATVCASCHGPQGDSNPSNKVPAPRNFRKEPFKNPKGGGPYALYLVLENGFAGNMPPQTSLSAAEKYAVIHYVRETFVKKDNAANYVENDSPEVAKEIPVPGSVAEGPEIPAASRPVKAEVYPMMAAMAASSEPDRRDADKWLAKALVEPPANVAALVKRLAPLADTQMLAQLHRAVREGDQKRFTDLLVVGAPGAFDPTFAVAPKEQIADLFAHLQRAVEALKPEAAAGKGKS
jgi:hypothetical protein